MRSASGESVGAASVASVYEDSAIVAPSSSSNSGNGLSTMHRRGGGVLTGGRGFLELCEYDLLRLRHGEFLNDSIIDFYLCHLARSRLCIEERERQERGLCHATTTADVPRNTAAGGTEMHQYHNQEEERDGSQRPSVSRLVLGTFFLKKVEMLLRGLREGVKKYKLRLLREEEEKEEREKATNVPEQEDRGQKKQKENDISSSDSEPKPGGKRKRGPSPSPPADSGNSDKQKGAKRPKRSASAREREASQFSSSRDLPKVFDMPECDEVLLRWARWMDGRQAVSSASAAAEEFARDFGTAGGDNGGFDDGQSLSPEEVARTKQEVAAMVGESIFSRDLILVPHADNLHWSLVAVCLPRLADPSEWR